MFDDVLYDVQRSATTFVNCAARDKCLRIKNSLCPIIKSTSTVLIRQLCHSAISSRSLVAV